MKSSEIYQAKREIINFCHQLTKGLSKPNAKFITDMIYGLANGCSPLLSEISRALEEDIDLLSTIKRLSRNAMEFNDYAKLYNNYLDMIKRQIKDDMLVIVDNSDITKPYGEQFESLRRVHDGSKGGTEKGYLTANMSITTSQTKHPIPVYAHTFSVAEEGFSSANVETYQGLNYIDELFNQKKYTVVMDRGYDSNDIIQFLQNKKTDFIIRLTDKRWLKNGGRWYKVPELATRHKGKLALKSTIKGHQYQLKVSHLKVTLPAFSDENFFVVIVYGYGQKPMKLLTNKEINSKADVLRIVKGYILRWRTEESFRVQKQEYNLEKVRTLSLNSIRLIHNLINFLVGRNSIRIESAPLFNEILYHRAKSLKAKDKIKFYLYRYIRGLSVVLKADTVGIRIFKKVEHRVNPGQMRLII